MTTAADETDEPATCGSSTTKTWRTHAPSVFLFCAAMFFALRDFQSRREIETIRASLPEVETSVRRSMLELVEEKTRQEKRGILPSASPNEMLRTHLPEEPIYIFREDFVSWKTLAPHEITDVVLDRPVQFFETPCTAQVALENVEVSPAGLKFHEPGEYPLLTQLGAFKILILPHQASRDEELISIARFVARNTVHCQGDERLAFVWRTGKIARSSAPRVASQFFTSPEPLKLMCGPVSTFLMWVLYQQGFRTSKVGLTRQDGEGHVGVQALFPDAGRWVFLDPDFGAMVEDAASQTPLSIEEIGVRLADGRRDSLKVIDFGPEYSLLPEHNMGSPYYDFVWTKDCHSKTRRVLDPEWYLDMLSDYSFDISVAPPSSPSADGRTEN